MRLRVLLVEVKQLVSLGQRPEAARDSYHQSLQLAGGSPKSRGRVMSRYLLGDSVWTQAPASLLRCTRSRVTRLLALPLGAVLAGALLSIVPVAPAQAACANPIVCENQLPGTPQSVWDVSNYSTTIQGFADPFSVNIGNPINFKIESPASSYKIDIYRMGYYGGDGARLITSLTPNIPVSQSQPACNTNTVTGLVDCGNWGVSATWNVPATAVSGVYFARIYRTDGTSGANQIPFVVTDNSSHSDVLFMTSDETWQAYNDWGGYSFYTGTATGSPWCCSAQNPGRGVQISYNRPFATRYDSISPNGQDFFFYAEFPMIEFLEKNGYNVSYVSQVDVAQPGAASMIEQHKVLMNTGHSEYWDAGDMSNMTAARNAGVNLALFTGNTAWWKTRWANSQFGNEPYRTLITYKESLDSTQSDPADPPTWTGAWRDQRFSPPGDASPENALTGQLWDVNCCSYADTVPSAYSKMQIWKNTAVASLSAGQTYTMPDETLGYEWDSDIDNGFRPAGEIDMSQTCENPVDQRLLTVTEEFVSDKACNSLTLYRASSGALVFDAGTIQWAWGLESDHDGDAQNPPDPVMQQATVNLFAMMGVQPATLESDLVPGVQPHDTAPPTSTITSPSAGATIANGSTVTVTGTATDSGGGVVAGVEVSTDGGSTWHPVTTMSTASTSVTWSYTWSAAGSSSVTLESRATDDDANMGSPGPGVSVTVDCPCSLFGASHVPYTTSANDSGSYELGMKFQSTVPGWVAGVRFYKGTGNGGTHTGSLWTSSGTLLATGTFTNETASGWQTLIFASPVQISPNTTYVVSYYDPEGHYSVDEEYFASQVNTPPLIGVKANYLTAGGGNGVFNAGGSGFPTQMNDSWSYSVDVIFDTTQPPSHPTVNSVTPYAGSSSNPTSTDPTATFSEAVVPNSVSFTLTDTNGNAVSGTTAFNSTDTVATFTPANSLAPGTTYTATISGAKDNNGETMLTPYTYTLTTSKSFDSGGKCPCAIWPDAAPSGVSDATDGSPVQLGVKFTASQDGSISGIRFYKVPDNTGTHTGSLWSSTGTLLATGTFTNESTEGWEELDFSTPVSITAGTTYVASYHTSAAHYAYTANGLASAVASGPLTASADGGVYAYGSDSTFPSNSAGAVNYWVDVVYTTPSGTFSPTVSSVTPTSGSSGNSVTVAPTATFSQAVVPSTASFMVKDSNGNTVAGAVTFNGADAVATFTPTNSLAADTTYTATMSGAQNTFGTPMSSPYSWTFTTAGAQCPCSIWPNTAQPSVASANDPGPVNLGVQFTPAVNGWITGIRFYKGAGNTGTHVGSLWTSSGTLLGQVTFSNESATGWQEADFSSPIPVTAGTTYVASYFAPNGGYSYDSAAFASTGITNGPLTAPPSSAVSGGNGLYSYNNSPGFPASTYNATNYWVDVVFTEP
jgi:methionine-rich copper-binding protein CopC